QLDAQRPGEVMLPLRPVEALAREAAAGGLDAAQVDTDSRQPLGAGGCDFEQPVVSRPEVLAALERARQRHADLPGQMVVAAATESQPLRLRAQCPAADLRLRSDRGQVLDRLRDMRARQPVVPVPALDLERQQTSGQKLRQMRARGLRGDACRIRQLTCRQRAPIEQGGEHYGARRVRQQECRAGEAGKLRMSLFGHGITLSSRKKRKLRCPWKRSVSCGAYASQPGSQQEARLGHYRAS